MAPNLPVTAYLGVAIRMEPPAGPRPALSPSSSSIPILLCRSPSTAPPTAPTSSPNGEAWGRVLGLPLLVAEADGRLREPFNRIGGAASTAISRRRRRSAWRRRPALHCGAGGHARQSRSCTAAVARSSLPLNLRAAGGPTVRPDALVVYRGEREIIARQISPAYRSTQRGPHPPPAPRTGSARHPGST